VKQVGDAALELFHHHLVAALRLTALATASETLSNDAFLVAETAPRRSQLNATLVASKAACALRKLDLDDVQHTCDVDFQALGATGVDDALQELRARPLEVAEVAVGPEAVTSATEVVVRNGEGFKAGGYCEHGDGALGGAVDAVAVVIEVVFVAADCDGDVAEVLLHGPDLDEEQLEGFGVLEGEVVAPIQHRKGIGADFFVDTNERSVVVCCAVSFSVLGDGQGQLFRLAIQNPVTGVGCDFGGPW